MVATIAFDKVTYRVTILEFGVDDITVVSSYPKVDNEHTEQVQKVLTCLVRKFNRAPKITRSI
jgi:hypothetical protein